MAQVFLIGSFLAMAVRPLIQNVYWSLFARVFIFSLVLVALGPLVSWTQGYILGFSTPWQLWKWLFVDSLSTLAVLTSSALIFRPQRESFTVVMLLKKLVHHCQIGHAVHFGLSMAFYCWLVFIVAEFLPIQYVVSSLVLKSFVITFIVSIFGKLFGSNETTFETSVALGILIFVIGDAVPALRHLEFNWSKTFGQLLPMLLINFIFCYTVLVFSKKSFFSRKD